MGWQSKSVTAQVAWGQGWHPPAGTTSSCPLQICPMASLGLAFPLLAQTSSSPARGSLPSHLTTWDSPGLLLQSPSPLGSLQPAAERPDLGLLPSGHHPLPTVGKAASLKENSASLHNKERQVGGETQQDGRVQITVGADWCIHRLSLYYPL